MTSKMQIYVFFITSTFVTKQNSSNSFNSVKLICCLFSLLMFIYYYRLQNSPYFCVFKLRALKQKVLNEQREALELLLRGKDVSCVLPTGFHKSLIYQMFVQVCSCKLFFKFRATADRHCYLAWVKRGIGRKHTTFTWCKNAACSNDLFSLSSRLCFGGKLFDWANVNFGRSLNIISYWEVVTRILILSCRHHLPSDARAFSFLAPLEM